MKEYVRVRKDVMNYNDQVNKINIQTIKDLLKQKQDLKEWLEEKKEYCIKEKEKKYVDDLGKEQLLGCYLTCQEVLERLGEE